MASGFEMTEIPFAPIDTTGQPDDTRLGRLEGQMDIVVQVLRDLRQEVRAVNTRIDRMFVATWAIGGGIIAALIGLIVQGG